MDSLRALVHVILSIAVLVAGIAQVGTSAAMDASGPRDHHVRAAVAMPVTLDGHDHAGVRSMPASHDHGAMSGSTADGRPVHRQDGCQTACCFTPGQETARVVEGRLVRPFRAVTYVDAVRAPTGRTRDPDPEIPKTAA